MKHSNELELVTIPASATTFDVATLEHSPANNCHVADFWHDVVSLSSAYALILRFPGNRTRCLLKPLNLQ